MVSVVRVVESDGKEKLRGIFEIYDNTTEKCDFLPVIEVHNLREIYDLTEKVFYDLELLKVKDIIHLIVFLIHFSDLIKFWSDFVFEKFKLQIFFFCIVVVKLLDIYFFYICFVCHQFS